MIIGIATDGHNISGHFGKYQCLSIVEVDDGCFLPFYPLVGVTGDIDRAVQDYIDGTLESKLPSSSDHVH